MENHQETKVVVTTRYPVSVYLAVKEAAKATEQKMESWFRDAALDKLKRKGGMA